MLSPAFLHFGILARTGSQFSGATIELVRRAASKPRDDRQKDPFRLSLGPIIDLGYPLVRLEQDIDWEFLSGRFGAACSKGSRHTPLSTPLP